MMCQRIGLPPISTIGFGRRVVSSANRVPNPPARITAFIYSTPSRAASGGQPPVGVRRSISGWALGELRRPRRAPQGGFELVVVLYQGAQRPGVDAPHRSRYGSALQAQEREQSIGGFLMVP